MQAPTAALLLKLQQANNSQASVENVSRYLLFYSQDATNVVNVWLEVFTAAAVDKRLALMYIANHTLQEGRKKGKDYVDAFAHVLPRAIRELGKVADDKTRRSIDRMIKIWDERRVFPPSFIKSFREHMAVKAKVGGSEPSLSGNGILKHSSGEGAAAAAAATAAAGADLKLAACGSLADVLQSASKAEQHSSFVSRRLQQMNPNVHVTGTFAEVASARDCLANSISALQSEMSTRLSAIAELKAMLSKQEAALEQVEATLVRYRGQRDQVEARFQAMTAAQQEAAAATAAASSKPQADSGTTTSGAAAAAAPAPTAAADMDPTSRIAEQVAMLSSSDETALLNLASVLASQLQQGGGKGALGQLLMNAAAAGGLGAAPAQSQPAVGVSGGPEVKAYEADAADAYEPGSALNDENLEDPDIDEYDPDNPLD